ncbi:MAG: type II toxin-antitoxin system VapB family antitoxin [Chloroflexota bacterium]|nr:type II toxin-antitoxin system VapB family antitoxin [Chloroflexota bacterium]
MRTLIDIQDELMRDLLRETQAKTKKEAIATAIGAYLDLKRRERLASLIGNYDFGYTQEDLEKMRADE